MMMVNPEAKVPADEEERRESGIIEFNSVFIDLINRRPSIPRCLSRMISVYANGYLYNLESTPEAGFTWIAVMGNESIWAVTCDDVPDGFLSVAIIVETDGFGCAQEQPAIPSRKKHAEMTRFAIVSCAYSGLPRDEDEYAHDDFTESEWATIKFLTRKLKDDSSLTNEETKQTAISALQCLLGEDFKGDAIKDHVVWRYDSVRHSDGQGKQLEMIPSSPLIYEDWVKRMRQEEAKLPCMRDPHYKFMLNIDKRIQEKRKRIQDPVDNPCLSDGEM